MNLISNFCRASVLVLSIFFSNSVLLAYKYDLAVCAIFQNEAGYLREWIEFHKLVGVTHFYLYNNLSSDSYDNVLIPYIKSGEVELIQWGYNTNPDGGNWPTIQVMAYNHAINLSKHQAKWLAIIDTDEFLFPVEVDNLSKFLLDFEDVAAVCVNWQMYGTSGVKKILPGHLLIKDLIYKAPAGYGENLHVKSIVRPEFVEANANPHCCIFLPGFYQVNSNKESFSGACSPVQIDKIRINHYWTRDENFFYNVKLPRRQKWQDGACIQRANILNQEVDTAIFKYVSRLQKALGTEKK
jgi:Glycosyltransferase family 92